jgi:hypothetical protein
MSCVSLCLLISHVSFLAWVCMLDVYYSERWYNMDWIILIICKTQQDVHYEDFRGLSTPSRKFVVLIP